MENLFFSHLTLHLLLVLLATSSISEAQLRLNRPPQIDSNTSVSDHHFLEKSPFTAHTLSELPVIGTNDNDRSDEERQELVVKRRETADQTCYTAKADGSLGGGTQGVLHQAKPCQVISTPQIDAFSEADAPFKQSVKEAAKSGVQLQSVGAAQTGTQSSMPDAILRRQHRPLVENSQLAAGSQSSQGEEEKIVQKETVTHLPEGESSEASGTEYVLKIDNMEETLANVSLLSRRGRSLLGTEKTVANYSDLMTGATNTAYTTLKIVSSFAVTGMVTISRSVTVKSDTALCGGRCTISGGVSLSNWVNVDL